MDKPIKEEKIFNLLMNARMRRTPNREIRFLDFRPSGDFQEEHISDFINVADLKAAREIMDSLAREAAKFTVVAVPGADAAVADLFRARPDVISALSLLDFASFKKKFPILLSTNAFASAAFPTFAAEDVLYAGLFSFSNATFSALGISRVVDMTPNGLEELPVSVSRHSEISSASKAVAAFLSEKQRVLIVDAQDGNLASLAATTGLALYLRIDAKTAIARVMAKTDCAFSPSAEDVKKISGLLAPTPRSSTSPALPRETSEIEFPMRAIPGIFTRISLPAPRSDRKFSPDSLDALQEEICTRRDNLSLAEREKAVHFLASTLLISDVFGNRDSIRQASALLAFIADEWSEEVELADEVIGKIRSIAAFCFENEPTEYHGEVQYSSVDGFPLSLTDCVRALVLALRLDL